MKSFLKLAAEELVKESKLLKINEIIDWGQLRLILKKIDRSGLGPSGYDTLSLLKSLRVRLDFFLFTDFDEKIPDSTTICRFRNLETAA